MGQSQTLRSWATASFRRFFEQVQTKTSCRFVAAIHWLDDARVCTTVRNSRPSFTSVKFLKNLSARRFHTHFFVTFLHAKFPTSTKQVLPTSGMWLPHSITLLLSYSFGSRRRKRNCIYPIRSSWRRSCRIPQKGNHINASAILHPSYIVGYPP